MPVVHYTNLLIVVTVGLLAPLTLGFLPRVRLPAIVLELVLGIVIGPSALGWAKPDLPVSILSLIGLAFLLFLSGMEIDVERLHGRILKLTAIGFAVSFAIAISLGLGLKAGGFRQVAALRRDRARRLLGQRDLPGDEGLQQHQLELWSVSACLGFDRGVRRDHPAVPVLFR